MGQRGLLSRLLSRRNQLSRIEKEEILERVLAGVAPDRRRRANRTWLAVCVGLGAAAALFLLLPRMSPRPAPGDDTFVARGKDEGPSFRVVCTDGAAESRCRVGSKLVFAITPGPTMSSFAAFARRDDGTVIWYFPESATGKSRDLGRDLVHGILETGILVGEEHASGAYEIYGVFSAAPMDRVDVKAFVNGEPLGAGQGVSAVLVKQRMTIE